MQHLSKALEHLEILRELGRDRDAERRQINIRLEVKDFYALEKLAEHFDTTPTGVAVELLSAAIWDAADVEELNVQLFTEKEQSK